MAMEGDYKISRILQFGQSTHALIRFFEGDKVDEDEFFPRDGEFRTVNCYRRRNQIDELYINSPNALTEDEIRSIALAHLRTLRVPISELENDA